MINYQTRQLYPTIFISETTMGIDPIVVRFWLYSPSRNGSIFSSMSPWPS